jgi:hypothetical protein
MATFAGRGWLLKPLLLLVNGATRQPAARAPACTSCRFACGGRSQAAAGSAVSQPGGLGRERDQGEVCVTGEEDQFIAPCVGVRQRIGSSRSVLRW